ncbi:sushi, von Willebrand factor type A, EGF and pentraxin domain-containing protein 1-like isoform X2 [Dysidea avara]|uniref:sushi, von Willebrand factor type A, EGF and pentraxin domain-containing protein 1-like isoform X2 n=1 Tax=Dysidea avara TaxID=196820 RepID=UPI003320CB56
MINGTMPVPTATIINISPIPNVATVQSVLHITTTTSISILPSVTTSVKIDCGEPDTPSNGSVSYTITTEGSTVVYSCDPGFVLCGDENRTCLSTGMWSGSVPDCISVKATFVHISYTVKEDDIFADITISLDRPSCVSVTVVVVPQEQSPVDASTSDFVDTPVMAIIQPGGTSAIVCIRIMDDSVVERDEKFDVVLQTQGNGVTVGNPGQTEVVIVDDDVVDCGEPDTPSNGGVSYTITTEGSTIVYSCDPGFVLCGDENRTCLSTGMWSGSVPDCISVEVSFGNILYIAKEEDAVVNLTISLDQPSCVSVTVVVVPQEQSPVDASKSDFVDTPITNTISPGDTSAVVSIPIIDDNLVERNEVFDVVLQLQGNEVTIGDFERANVIIDDNDVVNCGEPDTPSNGGVSYTITTEGSTVVYSCDPGFVLCGDENRTCLSTGMWSGSVPDCIRTEVTFGRTSYIFRENDSFTGIIILLHQPSCVNVTVVVVPQEQSPVDASKSDFVDTPITITISPGDTSALVFISIIDDEIVERNEVFDVVLQPQGNGVTIGSPGQAEVMIVDDDGVNCGEPDTPSNGGVNYTMTTEGSTVMYSCDPGFVLCGDENRTCLSLPISGFLSGFTGFWSGSVPDCIRAEVTVEHTSYTAKEDDGFADITISLDQPSCVSVTVVVVPQEQSPVDASKSDFVDTPITIAISPGDTSALVSIPIIDDKLLEKDEVFDVVLQTQGNGITIGNPGQAEVIIVDDDDGVDCEKPDTPSNGGVSYTITTEGSTIVYSCDPGFVLCGDENRTCLSTGMWSGSVPDCIRAEVTFGNILYIVKEGDGFVNLTISLDQPSCVSVTVVVVPQEQSPVDASTSDFVDANITITISPGDTSAVVSIPIIDDNLVEREERFVVVLQPQGNGITVGTPGQAVAVIVNDDVVDCGEPDTPSNGGVSDAITTEGSTVVYSCDSGFVLCGDENRTCLSTGMWSGSVPDCIRTEITFEDILHIVDENASVVNLTISLDQPSCISVTVVVVPQEQSPVDASKSDFVDTPITITISPGDTSALVSIPIIDDNAVEKDERFDVVLQAQGNGATIGSSGQATVIIGNDDVIIVSFRKSSYEVGESDKNIRICLSKNGQNDIPVTVNLRPEETGSAEARSDFDPKQGSVTFTRRSRECYRQRITNDNVPERTESFKVSMESNQHISIGNPSSAEIEINDDDEGCGIPDEPKNGRARYSTTMIGDEAIYICDENYELKGDSTRRCQRNGLWSGSVPVCEFHKCPIEGQVFTESPQCPETCAQLPPEFTLPCGGVRRCQCSSGTVLDEKINKCVLRDKCTCPPNCTHDFCSRLGNSNSLCSRPDVRSCPDDCSTTFCHACYYSETQLTTPSNCRVCRNGIKEKCLRRWANCVERNAANQCTDFTCKTELNFRCYDYPSCTPS